ncbi:TauD/TfdA family dioxygenase [Mesorhizobium abyssinicae]
MKRTGWAKFHVGGNEAEIVEVIKGIGAQLGPFARGRTKSVAEVLLPQERHNAHPRSLSARFGTGQLPFHAELSHRSKPCRYLVLGCVDPGTSISATLLIDWHRLGLTEQEVELLESAPVLVRTGRRSFYSTMLPRSHEYLRFDPGCIQAVDARGNVALSILEERIGSAMPYRHDWRKGDILLIDNWRVLHGREATEMNTNRKLARVLIDG